VRFWAKGSHLIKRSHWQIKAPCKPLLKSKLGLEGANGI
jgi:hypothetical protein